MERRVLLGIPGILSAEDGARLWKLSGWWVVISLGHLRGRSPYPSMKIPWERAPACCHPCGRFFFKPGPELFPGAVGPRDFQVAKDPVRTMEHNWSPAKKRTTANSKCPREWPGEAKGMHSTENSSHGGATPAMNAMLPMTGGGKRTR